MMEQFGDGGKKLWPTEFGWGSSPTPYPGYEYEARIGEEHAGRTGLSEAFRIMANSGYVGVPFLWNLNYPLRPRCAPLPICRAPGFRRAAQMIGR